MGVHGKGASSKKCWAPQDEEELPRLWSRVAEKKSKCPYWESVERWRHWGSPAWSKMDRELRGFFRDFKLYSKETWHYWRFSSGEWYSVFLRASGCFVEKREREAEPLGGPRCCCRGETLWRWWFWVMEWKWGKSGQISEQFWRCNCKKQEKAKNQKRFPDFWLVPLGGYHFLEYGKSDIDMETMRWRAGCVETDELCFGADIVNP